MNRFTAGLMAAASAAALAVLPGAASASASTGWSAQTTPSPPGALSAELSGVACGSPADCTAVGSYDTTSGTVNLAERYNGSTWAIQFTPDSGSGDSLSGVACISAADCIAVGSTGYGTDPLIESWNGTAWTIDTIPPGGGSLKEIKCFGAADCIAVGWNSSSNTPLIESWNGTSWTVQAVPSGVQGSLFGISCVTASSCYASGDYENGRAKPLLLHWNGTAWAAQASPALPKVFGVPATEVNLDSVACYGSDCTAAGGAFYWEGTPEASVTTTLAERWNGSAWSIEKTVNPGGNSPGNDFLYAVRCPSATSCTAAGEYGDDADGSPGLPLIETWNGSTWSQATVPDPSHGNGSGFTGLTCFTASCTAVGSQDSNINGSVPERPLAERN